MLCHFPLNHDYGRKSIILRSSLLPQGSLYYQPKQDTKKTFLKIYIDLDCLISPQCGNQPSWELAYLFPKHFWVDDFPNFPFGRICYPLQNYGTWRWKIIILNRDTSSNACFPSVKVSFPVGTMKKVVKLANQSVKDGDPWWVVFQSVL